MRELKHMEIKMNTEKKFKIGIDLDDVVFEFVRYLSDYLDRNHGVKVGFEDFISYKFSDFLDFTNEEMIDIIGNMISNSKNLEYDICEGAVESIKELSVNSDIYFITSRVHLDGTEESLEKLFFDIDYELIVSSNPYVGNKGRDKGEICLDLGIDYMIEDSYEHVLSCLEKGIKCFLINKPWNLNYIENKKIIRVNSWNEILEVLKNVE